MNLDFVQAYPKEAIEVLIEKQAFETELEKIANELQNEIESISEGNNIIEFVITNLVEHIISPKNEIRVVFDFNAYDINNIIYKPKFQELRENLENKFTSLIEPFTNFLKGRGVHCQFNFDINFSFNNNNDTLSDVTVDVLFELQGLDEEFIEIELYKAMY